MVKLYLVFKCCARAVVLAFFTLLFPALAHAQFTYTTNADSTLTITGYTGPMGAVTFPTNINGLTVSGIATRSFLGNTNLTDATIPGSITNIAQDAFDACTGLTNVVMGEGCTSIPNFAFEQCANLSSVTLPSTIQGIGQFAFYFCSRLTTINIPPSVGGIGGDAFIGCGFTNFTLPNTVTNLGGYNFASCPNLGSFTFAPGTNQLTSPVIGVLQYCTALTNVVLSSNLTVLGDYMFQGCTSLTSCSIPPNVTGLGTYLFQGSGLTSIIIPASVTNIAANGFSGSAALTNVSILGNCTIGPDAFCWYKYGNSGSLAAVVPVQSLYIAGGTIGYQAFYYCTNLSNLTLGNQVTDIGELAFSTTALKNVTIPGSCTHIEAFAFEESALTNVNFGEGVQTIDGYAFSRCHLTSLSLPASLRSIGEEGFSVNPVTNLYIANGLTAVGDLCFESFLISYVTIPTSFSNLGPHSTFAFCPNLTAVVFLSNAPSVFSNTFYSSDTNLVVFYLPGTTGWSNTFAGFPTALWNPSIQKHDSNFGLRNGMFGFNVTGATNLSLAIQSCTNLKSGWTTVTNVTLTNGSFYFSDPQPVAGSSRFYRLAPPP